MTRVFSITYIAANLGLVLYGILALMMPGISSINSRFALVVTLGVIMWRNSDAN